jgi:hypothetical protein
VRTYQVEVISLVPGIGVGTNWGVVFYHKDNAKALGLRLEHAKESQNWTAAQSLFDQHRRGKRRESGKYEVCGVGRILLEGGRQLLQFVL